MEFGCGTGRLALRLLQRELPADARYLGVDVSETMVALATTRLAPYRDRAEARLSHGEPRLPVADASADRIVSTYVVDLLSDDDTGRLLQDAARALAPEGLLCLVGITVGAGLVGRVVSGVWSAAYALNPRWVGGCRPRRVVPVLTAGGWSIRHAAVVRAWGVSSEVVVAQRARGEA